MQGVRGFCGERAGRQQVEDWGGHRYGLVKKSRWHRLNYVIPTKRLILPTSLEIYLFLNAVA